MRCRNCEKQLNPDSNYCSNCGAKVIRNRITIKNLSQDISDRYIKVDNAFLRTAIHLFTKPELVIDGYIQGVRKKYLSPIRYLGIALTLSGLIFYIAHKIYASEIDMDVFHTGTDPKLYQKIMPVVGEIQSLLFILYVPIFTITGWLSFNKRKYVLSEFFVIILYTFSQWAIITFPIGMIILLTDPADYIFMNTLKFPIMLVYIAYTIQRLNRFSIGSFLARTSLFFTLSFVGFLGLIFVLYLFLFLTGTITMEDIIQ